MRRLMLLVLVIALGSGSLAALPAGALNGESDFGDLSTTEQFEGVAAPRPQIGTKTPFQDAILQPYEVFFGEQYARIDNEESESGFETEFMVIEVKAGIFALRVGDEGTFVVDPAGESPIQFVELQPDEQAPPYVVPLQQYVRDEAGNICTNMCALPLEMAVQVKPGDIIIAHAGSYCLWCLLLGTDTELNQTSGTGNGIPDSGLLLVSALVPGDNPETFSWLSNWSQGSGDATPEALTRSVKMAWAYNPPSGCH
jgi:hypothetical protein